MTISFDWNQLHQLAGGDSDFEVELLDMFINDAESSIQQLSEAVSASNVSMVEDIAHYLKGASANVGARALSSAAAQLELQAKRGKLAQAQSLLGQLQSACQEVRQVMLARR
jgi:HPt (histidine-containing phosphotransfer) domain-containing protein